MPRSTTLLFSFAFLTASALTASAQDEPALDFSWERDLVQAEERAAREKKLLLVVFRCLP